MPRARRIGIAAREPFGQECDQRHAKFVAHRIAATVRQRPGRQILPMIGRIDDRHRAAVDPAQQAVEKAPFRPGERGAILKRQRRVGRQRPGRIMVAILEMHPAQHDVGKAAAGLFQFGIEPVGNAPVGIDPVRHFDQLVDQRALGRKQQILGRARRLPVDQPRPVTGGLCIGPDRRRAAQVGPRVGVADIDA